MNAKELREEAVKHKEQFVDGGVPVAPCLTNLVMPILQKNLPEKMIPRSQKRTSNENEFATEMQEGIANKGDAVGRATVQKEMETEADKDQLSQTPNQSPKRRWRSDALQSSSKLKAVAPKAKLKVVAPKAKAAGSFLSLIRRRFKTKTTDKQSASEGSAAKSVKPCRKRPTAKFPAAKGQKSTASSSKCSAQE